MTNKKMIMPKLKSFAIGLLFGAALTILLIFAMLHHEQISIVAKIKDAEERLLYLSEQADMIQSEIKILTKEVIQ